MSVEPREEAAYDGYAVDYRDWWAPVIGPAAVSLLDHLDGAVGPGHTLVDIGAGTGTLAVAALRRWPGLNVIAIDPARRLLEWAESDARDAGLRNRLTTQTGDAEELPLADGSVDLATSTFVLQLVPDRARAVREAHRVLRPGGLFAHLTWRTDEDPFEPEDVFDDVLEDLDIAPPERPDGGPGASYASASEAADELRAAGFTDVRAQEEWLVHRFTPEQFVGVAEHWTEDDVFAAIDEPMRARLRQEVVRRLERLDPEALVYRRPLISAIGHKP